MEGVSRLMTNGVTDELYLDNLEEWICEQHKIVTYKWLSNQLLVSSDVAKQMLFAFSRQKDTRVKVIYLLAGTKEGRQAVLLVADSSLGEAKKHFQKITTLHVYSVQHLLPKDSAELWAVEQRQIEGVLKDNPQFSPDNRYSSIYCASAQEKRQAKPASAPNVQDTPQTLKGAKGQKAIPAKQAKPTEQESPTSSPDKNKENLPVGANQGTRKKAAATPKAQGANKGIMASFFKPISATERQAKLAQDMAGINPHKEAEPNVQDMLVDKMKEKSTKKKAVSEAPNDEDDELLVPKREVIAKTVSASLASKKKEVADDAGQDIKKLAALTLDEQPTKRRLRKAGDRKRKRPAENEDETGSAEEEEEQAEAIDTKEPTKKKRRVQTTKPASSPPLEHKQDSVRKRRRVAKEASDSDEEPAPIKEKTKRPRKNIKKEREESAEEMSDNPDQAKAAKSPKKPGQVKTLDVLPQALRSRGEKKQIRKTKLVKNAQGYKEPVEYWEDVEEEEPKAAQDVPAKVAPSEKKAKRSPNKATKGTEPAPKRAQTNILNFFGKKP